MKIGIIRLYVSKYCGEIGYYNIQELGLAKKLIDYNNQVYVFFIDNKIKKEKVINFSDNIVICYLPGGAIGKHGYFNLDLLNKYKLEIIQLMADNQFFSLFVSNWCKKNEVKLIPYIGVTSSDSSNKLKVFVSKILFKYIVRSFKEHEVIAKTLYVKKELENSGLQNVHYIPVGLDISDYISKQIDVRKEHLRRKYNISKNKMVILFIGRLTETKRPLELLDIFNAINKASDFHLIIIGDGELKEKVKQKIKDLNIEKNVTLFKKVSNEHIWKFYKMSDVILNLNKVEIFGMTILEAMYFGCPVVAHIAPGPSTLIKHNVTGKLLESYNVMEWESAVHEVILKGDIYKKYAKENVLNNFTWEALVDKFMDVYELK